MHTTFVISLYSDALHFHVGSDLGNCKIIVVFFGRYTSSKRTSSYLIDIRGTQEYFFMSESFDMNYTNDHKLLFHIK